MKKLCAVLLLLLFASRASAEWSKAILTNNRDGRKQKYSTAAKDGRRAVLVLEVDVETPGLSLYVDVSGTWIPHPSVRVVHYLDLGKLETETWIPRSRSRAYSPNPRALLTAFRSAQEFTVRIFDESGKAETYAFDVSGAPHL